MEISTISVLSSCLNTISRLANHLSGKGSGTSSITAEIKYALKLLNAEPSLVIDIGGNNGEYSAKIKEKCNKCEIHIFEPSQICYSRLQTRFASDRKIIINQHAISNLNQIATLHTNQFGSGLASLNKRRLDHFNIEFDKSEPATLVRFEDYWINNLNKRSIDIVKIDIEGHELQALEGMGHSVSKTKLIQFEFGGANIDSKTYFQDLWYFFSKRNFVLFRIAPIGLIKIDKYSETDEIFLTTNYLALNNSPSL